MFYNLHSSAARPASLSAAAANASVATAAATASAGAGWFVTRLVDWDLGSLAYAVAFVEIRTMGDFRLQATDPDKNIGL